MPPIIANDGHWLPARLLIICFSKSTPQAGLHAQHREVSTGDQLQVQLFRLAARSPYVHDAIGTPGVVQNCRHLGKDFLALPHLLIERIGKEIPAFVREASVEARLYAIANAN